MMHFGGGQSQLFLLICLLEIFAISALPLLHEIGNHSLPQQQIQQSVLLAGDEANKKPEADGIQKEQFESTKLTLGGRSQQHQQESDDGAKRSDHLTADAPSVMDLSGVIGAQMKGVENFHEQLESHKHHHAFPPPIELPLPSSSTTASTTTETTASTNDAPIGEEAKVGTTQSLPAKEQPSETAKAEGTDSTEMHNETMETQVEHSKIEEKPKGKLMDKNGEEKMAEPMKEKKEMAEAKHSVEDAKKPEFVEDAGHDAKSDKKDDEKSAIVIAIESPSKDSQHGEESPSKDSQHAEGVGQSEDNKKDAAAPGMQMAPPQVDEYLTEELEVEATEKELNILQKIILGFRCSSQDCADTLKDMPDGPPRRLITGWKITRRARRELPSGAGNVQQQQLQFVCPCKKVVLLL